ncbi:MAG: serine/threonine-protein kinase [Polyangiaceae bacterium]
MPRIVGRYALFDEIAAGGMATIHLGRLVGPVGFARTVAIKSLHPQFARDPEFVESFLDEARLASRIHHPNVVSTVDVVTTEGEVFLVMEYVAGESLAKLVRSSLKRGLEIPPSIALSILTGMLHGLHATHEARNEKREPMNIVHRDVSPQNILVGLDGISRVLDFGVAKAAMRAQATRDGQMKGKLSYMSPEQLNSREVDRRTDVFAAGIVAWECLVGRRLFAGSDPGEVLAKVLTLDIPSPREVSLSVSEPISNAIMRALEREPDRRWATAREFAICLEQSGTLAAGHRVGEWVEENATDALRERQRRVTAVESATIDLALDPATQTISERPIQRPVSMPSQLRLENSEPVDFSNAGSSTTQAANLTVTSPSPALPEAPGRHGWLALAFGAILLVTAGGVYLWSRGVPERTAGFKTAQLPEISGAADPPVTAEPPTRVVADGPAAASKPTQDEETTALAATPAVEPAAPPDAGAPKAEAPIPPPAAKVSEVEKRATKEKDRRGWRGPVRNPKAKAKARPTGGAKAGATPRATETDKAKSADCIPPFVVDASGIKRAKPECL